MDPPADTSYRRPEAREWENDMADRTRRRRFMVPMVVALALAAAGCNLPAGQAGARCAKVGAIGQDGTYLLKCTAKRRWERGITIAAGQALIAALNARAAAATPPPAPPVPAVTTFGAVDLRVGTGSGQIVPGVYTTSGENCTWARYDAADNGLGGNIFSGREFLQIAPGDGWITTTGPCVWTPAPASAQTIPATGDATFRVGIEAQPGWYRTSGSSDCRWGIYDSLDGSDASTLDTNFSSGPQLVHLLATDVAFESRRCGNWTLLAGQPAVVLAIDNAERSPIFPQRRAVWTEVDVAHSGAGVYAPMGGLQVGFIPVNGEQLHLGLSTLMRYPFQDPGTVGLNLTVGAGGCNTTPGQVNITRLETDLNGDVVHFEASFTAHCGTLADPAFTGYISF